MPYPGISEDLRDDKWRSTEIGTYIVSGFKLRL